MFLLILRSIFSIFVRFNIRIVFPDAQFLKENITLFKCELQFYNLMNVVFSRSNSFYTAFIDINFCCNLIILNLNCLSSLNFLFKC